MSAATACLLLVGAAAWGSEVDVAVVDVVSPTNAVTLAVGSSSAITINLSVTGNQTGTATFEVHREWTLAGGVWTGANPQEFTVAPRGGGDTATTFSTTGSVTVAADQPGGTYGLQVGAFDITNSNATGAKLAAGDSATYSVTVTGPSAPTDTTAPVITPVITGTEGDNGWYTSDVTLSWTVVDAESTITSTTGCETVTITNDQAAADYECEASSAGGTASESVSIKRDATAPTVSLVGGPTDGATYYPHNPPTEPTCDAQDDTSGVASCTVTGFVTSIGQHTVRATATDNAGNSAADAALYDIAAFTLGGFYAPVDMGGVFNTVKGGSTVPLKFEVFAGAEELTSTAAVSGLGARKVTCTTGATEDAIEVTATGGTALRYDTSGGQFIHNWQTPRSAGSCYVVTVTLVGDQTISASFKLK